MFVCADVWAHGCGEARGDHQVACSIILCSNYLRQSLSVNLELGQQVAVIFCLFPTPSYSTQGHTQNFFMVLRI